MMRLAIVLLCAGCMSPGAFKEITEAADHIEGAIDRNTKATLKRPAPTVTIREVPSTVDVPALKADVLKVAAGQRLRDLSVFLRRLDALEAATTSAAESVKVQAAKVAILAHDLGEQRGWAEGQHGSLREELLAAVGGITFPPATTPFNPAPLIKRIAVVEARKPAGISEKDFHKRADKWLQQTEDKAFIDKIVGALLNYPMETAVATFGGYWLYQKRKKKKNGVEPKPDAA